jgi:hypothetical protein
MLFSSSAYSQIKINICNNEKNSLSYVNVSLKGMEDGFHSNEDGEIVFDERFLNKKVTFNKVGYADTTVTIHFGMDTIVLQKADIYNEKYPEKDGNRIVKKGILNGNRSGIQSNSARPQIYLQYFPSDDHHGYYLDEIRFKTKNEIDKAKINLRFYAANRDLEPEAFLYDKDVLVNVEKGEQINKIDLSKLNIRIPERGLFVGFENLIIPENIFKYDQTNLMTEETRTKTDYMPNFVMLLNEKDNLNSNFAYVLTNGNFHKINNKDMSLSLELKFKRP